MRSRWVVHLTVAFGLAIRIAALSRVGGRFLYYDNPAYDQMALQLLPGRNSTHTGRRACLTIWAFFHWIFGPGMLIARASTAACVRRFLLCALRAVQRFASRSAATRRCSYSHSALLRKRWAFYPPPSTLRRCVWRPLRCWPWSRAAALLVAAAALGLVLLLALVRANSLGLTLVVPRVAVVSHLGKRGWGWQCCWSQRRPSRGGC